MHHSCINSKISQISEIDWKRKKTKWANEDFVLYAINVLDIEYSAMNYLNVMLRYTVDPVHMSGKIEIEIENRKCNWPWIVKLLIFVFLHSFFAIESIFFSSLAYICNCHLILYYAKAHIAIWPIYIDQVLTFIPIYRLIQSNDLRIFINQIIQFLNLVVGGWWYWNVVKLSWHKSFSPLYAIA